MGGSAVKIQNMSKKPSSSKQDDTPASDKDEVTDSDNVEITGSAKNEPTDDDKGDATEILVTDPDPVQIGEAGLETRDAGPIQPEGEPEPEPEPEINTDRPAATAATPSPPPRRGIPWFGLLNFLLIVALAAAAGYYWREQQRLAATYQTRLAGLQAQLDDKASSGALQSSLSPLRNEIGSLDSKVGELALGQEGLRESSEKLFQLWGRDKNDWQLAEVEYLMRVAQHKLILQDDFAGAAITLQAASDLIGETGDPGLLPVRVMISEEIADLKTRRRADLVGMTLMLAQLGRQVRSLQPGFAVRVEEQPEAAVAEPQTAQDWLGRFNALLHSLISIRKESTDPTEIEANIVDVSAALEDNLKLARWAVLERDARQFQLLIDRSLQLFREFYDLDNAANHDFMTQLQDLQKMVINPEKPDITASLRELQRILSQRDNAPPPTAAPATEAGNG
jgi:uroporphyrin-3 C-methyltransferase